MQFRAFLLQFIVALYIAGSGHAAGGGTLSFAGGIATNHLENIEILYKFDEILKDLLSINSTLAVQTARKYLNILRLNTGVISNITLRTADDISYNLGVKYINESHFMKEKPVTCGALEHLFLDYIVPMRVNKPVKTNSLVIDAFNEYKLDNNRVLLTNSQKLWQIYCNKYREHSRIKVRIYKNMVSQANLLLTEEISVLTSLPDLQQLCKLEPNQSFYYFKESKLIKMNPEKRSLLANSILPPAVNIIVK